MKNLKSFCAAAALVATLTAPARADDVRTVVFCGFGGPAFCVGMSRLAAAVGGELRDWTEWKRVADDLIAERPKTVRLAGFSMGGAAAMDVAERLTAAGIEVERVAVLAPFGGHDTTAKVKERWRRNEITAVDHVALAFVGYGDEMAAFLNGAKAR